MLKCDLYVNNVFWKKIEVLDIHQLIKIPVFDMDRTYLLPINTEVDDVRYVLEDKVHTATFNIETMRQTVSVCDDYYLIFYKGHCNDPCFYLNNQNSICYRKIVIPKIKKIFTRYELMDFEK